MALMLFGLMFGAGLAAPAAVLADCPGGPVWSSVNEARGDTFVGVFKGVSHNSDGDEIFHWVVERVYAGDVKRGPLVGWGGGLPSCHPTHYVEGMRYLVSSEPGGGDAFSTVAYRVLNGGHIRLVAFEGTPSEYPRALQVDTVAEALNVLVRSLPPTDAARTGQAGSSSWMALLGVILLGSLTILLTLGLPHRARGASDVGQPRPSK